jgi:glycosyltransferase involved in cell wall biosynthesis
MLRSLPSDEFECHVVVPGEPPLRAEYEAAGATIHIVPMRRISTSHGVGSWLAYAFSWPFAVTRLTHLVRLLQIDVLHTNSLHSWYGWAVARFARKPHVWHAREIVVQSGAALRVERFLARRAARVVCGSQAIADQLDPDNTVVIYDTPDPDVFSPSKAGRFRAHHDIADDVPLAGVVGRLDTWKGIDVLLDAWPGVKHVHQQAHLVIAGAPVQGKEQYANELEARARALPDVHWLGEIDEAAVADLFADLDVLVAPSTQPEPYGLSVAEALVSGAAVVATDAGGPREILAAASAGAGRLVPMGDVAALTTAIVAVLDGARGTSVTARTARPRLLEREQGDIAAVLRGVALQAPPAPEATK